MRFVMFYHSLVSDWNHGNAHFLRGVVRDLRRRDHQVLVHEPLDGWSRSHLLADHGSEPLMAFERAYSDLRDASRAYPDFRQLDLDATLAGADVVIVHEWSEPELVARIGAHHAQRGTYTLLFHDTHHRAASDPQAMARYDLSAYDGVLAFGGCLRDLYRQRGWARRAWTWHEAADDTVFRPLPGAPEGDLVWIGNWGDGERSAELNEFLIAPVRALHLRARVYGVRYPPEAQRALAAAGIDYRGWLPNFEVPSVFGHFRVTVHVPRRPYAEALPGIPTIRPFEALACGIPLVSAPWSDQEGLFCAGRDYLMAHDGAEMTAHLGALLASSDLRARLSEAGRRTIAARHTCAHRVDRLLGIIDAVRRSSTGQTPSAGQVVS